MKIAGMAGAIFSPSIFIEGFLFFWEKRGYCEKWMDKDNGSSAFYLFDTKSCNYQ